MERSDYLLELFERHAQRIRVLSSCEQRRRSGIVTFRLEGGEPQDSVYRRLMSAGVVCASRGGGVRFSPHFYTPLSDLDRAVEKLLSI